MSQIKYRILASLKTVVRNCIFLILMPFVLIVFVIRPLILIRIGFVDGSRIGHFCNFAGYVCKENNKSTFDILIYSDSICNEYLKKLFDRIIDLYQYKQILYYFAQLLKKWDKHNKHEIKFPIEDLRLTQKDCFSSKFHFSDDEKRSGDELLERLNIPLGSKWVCLHNRDGAYLNKEYNGRDWNYHNFRDFSVESMLPAAEELVKRGYYVLRMGAITDKPLISENPKIIDYANSTERNEFADIFLLGGCDFYLGSDSGIYAISTLFNKPYSFINFPAPEAIYLYHYWNTTPFILKRALHKESNRLLSLKEIFEAGIANASSVQDYEKAGIELIENDPEDITQLAIEVIDRINGSWEDKKEDLELQKEFWNIYAMYVPNFNLDEVKANIGADFLRKNKDMLK